METFFIDFTFFLSIIIWFGEGNYEGIKINL